MSPETAAILDGLKDFQRRTVEHVSRRMLDEDARRFLVADEVGLGKTLVARGVVANTVERLRTEGVQRINVVYVCSNQEIARQNLDRLRLPGQPEGARLSRLGLLPLKMAEIAETGVNFVSLTPGTSLDAKSSNGWAQERAILLRMLQGPWDIRMHKRVRELFRVGAGHDRFDRELDRLGPLHPGLCAAFAEVIADSPLRATFEELLPLAARGLRGEENGRRLDLIGGLRRELARVCIQALQPHLVILDEFQRFGHLLDSDDEDALLARRLFEYDNGQGEHARTLLLSATPFKGFTRAAEEGPDHQSELLRLLAFLYENRERAGAVEGQLKAMRELLLSPQPSEADLVAARRALETSLSNVMVRTERLASSATRNGMLEPRQAPKVQLEVEDVRQWRDLSRLHALLRDRGLLNSSGAMTEFWKSAPWLAQFMDRYEFKKAIDKAVKRPKDQELQAALDLARKQMDWDGFEHYEDLAPPNARIRSLVADTVDQSWDLLWLPPSMPYYEAGAPFDRPGVQPMTKRLVFSAWNVVPRAIAGFLSYEAERRVHRAVESAPMNTLEERTRREKRPLDFGIDSRTGNPRGMPNLAWMYPSEVLSNLADPRKDAATLAASGLPSQEAMRDLVRQRVTDRLRSLTRASRDAEGFVDQRWYWAAPLLLDREDGVGDFWNADLALAWAGELRDDATNWKQHVDRARRVAIEGLDDLGRPPEDLEDVLTTLAIGGPGVCALRALRGVLPDADPDALQRQAARIAWGFRHLFNQAEGVAVVRATGLEGAYWRSSLQYAVAGNLQAVMDEWLHVLAEAAGAGRKDHDEVFAGIRKGICGALELASGRVEVDRIDGGAPVNFRTHFALRYGQAKEDGRQDSDYVEAVRAAFNSPMRPFVMASTSVGQEGLDFHTYCHAIVHWNVSSNPVDLEQREGRVHRYKGHAIRKNVAAHFAPEALRAEHDDPWAAAFEAALAARTAEQDDLVPYWLHTGPAVIERYVPALPYSKDSERLREVLRRVTLYRMVFGQPRQDDLIAYLQEQVGQKEAERLAELVRIDLSPS